MKKWIIPLLPILMEVLCSPVFALDAYQVIQRSSTIFVLEGKEQFSTNIGIVASGNDIVLIDPMPETHRLVALQQKVESLMTSSTRYIANTHGHEDHTGGNQFFIESGAQKIESKRLQALGVKTLSVDSHTGNDKLFYHEPSNTLFTGDVFDNSWHPTFYAGGIEGFTEAMMIILSVTDDQTLVVPGHGALANRDTVERFFRNTLHWVAVIGRLYKNQTSVEDMMTEPEVIEALSRFNPSQKEDWFPPRAFQRFIERTIEQLNRKQD